MNPGIATGANMTVVGMSTVFVALTLLALVITALARLIAEPSEPTATATSVSTSTPEPTAPRHLDLARVAVAAWAVHRTRWVVVAPISRDSEWRRAGRQSLVARLSTQR